MRLRVRTGIPLPGPFYISFSSGRRGQRPSSNKIPTGPGWRTCDICHQHRPDVFRVPLDLEQETEACPHCTAMIEKMYQRVQRSKARKQERAARKAARRQSVTDQPAETANVKERATHSILRFILAFTVVAGLALAVTTAAQASSDHWCRQGDPPIHASSNTSCAFTGNVVNTWARASWYDGGAYVYSPVTHKRYAMTFTYSRGYVLAVALPRTLNIWVRFSADL